MFFVLKLSPAEAYWKNRCPYCGAQRPYRFPPKHCADCGKHLFRWEQLPKEYKTYYNKAFWISTIIGLIIGITAISYDQ